MRYPAKAQDVVVEAGLLAEAQGVAKLALKFVDWYASGSGEAAKHRGTSGEQNSAAMRFSFGKTGGLLLAWSF